MDDLGTTSWVVRTGRVSLSIWHAGRKLGVDGVMLSAFGQGAVQALRPGTASACHAM